MTSRILLVAATAALTLGAGASVAQADSTLYLQQASGGTLKGDTLTLRGVAPRTTTFADRPQRTGGDEATRSFVSGFGRAFGSDAPNAALEVTDAPASRDVALLELRAPRYDAAKRTLTYTVRQLRSTGAANLAGLAKRNDGAKVTHFGRATLFIDDGSTAVAPTVLAVSVTIPGGVQGSVTLSDATFELGTNASVSGITTFGGSTGTVELSPSTATFSAQPGGGMTFDLVMLAQPSGSTVDGTASIPTGATVTIAPTGGKPVTIGNGAFSVPLSS
jgi:hypothetical protein